MDATGAGDAYLGAMAAMLAEGCALPDAARFANAAAALKTTTKGAQASPTRDAVEALLGREP